MSPSTAADPGLVDLFTQLRVGVLITLKRDGRPQSSVVGHTFDPAGGVWGWCGAAPRPRAAARGARCPWCWTCDSAAGQVRACAGRADTHVLEEQIQQPQQHGGDHARPLSIIKRHWSATCAASGTPQAAITPDAYLPGLAAPLNNHAIRLDDAAAPSRPSDPPGNPHCYARLPRIV